MVCLVPPKQCKTFEYSPANHAIRWWEDVLFVPPSQEYSAVSGNSHDAVMGGGETVCDKP